MTEQKEKLKRLMTKIVGDKELITHDELMTELKNHKLKIRLSATRIKKIVQAYKKITYDKRTKIWSIQKCFDSVQEMELTPIAKDSLTSIQEATENGAVNRVECLSITKQDRNLEKNNLKEKNIRTRPKILK